MQINKKTKVCLVEFSEFIKYKLTLITETKKAGLRIKVQLSPVLFKEYGAEKIANILEVSRCTTFRVQQSGKKGGDWTVWTDYHKKK